MAARELDCHRGSAPQTKHLAAQETPLGTNQESELSDKLPLQGRHRLAAKLTHSMQLPREVGVQVS